MKIFMETGTVAELPSLTKVIIKKILWKLREELTAIQALERAWKLWGVHSFRKICLQGYSSDYNPV
jgi:hypothetical protein